MLGCNPWRSANRQKAGDSQLTNEAGFPPEVYQVSPGSPGAAKFTLYPPVDITVCLWVF